MILRPYQEKATVAVTTGWAEFQRQLGVAATGAGKTIMFSFLASQEAGRTLILAHRETLVNQAVQKLHSATGIFASVEQGANRAMPGHGVIVASVQSMRSRLSKYKSDAFDLIICDEAHHVLSDDWQKVLAHFPNARVLGVTATPDRADKKSLGQYFQNVAFEVGILELITSGHLCSLRALKLDVKINAGDIAKRKRDYNDQEASDAITPQLAQLARAVASEIWDKKALVFLPRCDVSELFAEALCAEGINARHVQGVSADRDDKLSWFQGAAAGSALCNAMLLMEGYDQPDIDCIVWLRMTKNRSLFMQGIGRGTRLFPDKEFCLVIDPLWICGEVNICQLADIVAPNQLHKEVLQRQLETGLDIVEAEARAKIDVETLLAERIKEARKNKKAPKGMIDPLAWSMGIHDSDLSEYEPTMPWEEENPTAAQVAMLKHWNIWVESESMTRGYALKLLERIKQRDEMGLATPSQVMLMRRLGNPDAETMSKEQASKFIAEDLQRKRRAA